MAESAHTIVFSGGKLDRSALLRRDPVWLAQALDAPSSKFLPLWKLQVLVKSGNAPSLAWARSGIRDSVRPESPLVLLGVADEAAHFAIDVSELEDAGEELGLGDAAHFTDLRAIASQLPTADAAAAAQARSLIDWHQRHRYCAACGGPSASGDGGYQRRCEQGDCAAEQFPRTDPVVIMLVTHGERCQLGRQSGWPPGMFSALAGFVEPGETLEESVRREVGEEAGIEVASVRYRFSQPWPFPSSLMLGCVAEAASEKISVDLQELEAAQWFPRDAVTQALRSPPGPDGLWLPPPMAIAHQLVRAWIEGD
ncbi:MAG: NAD(+) diphosphatase [Myxococcota bacterium]|nr:NAD(+) diphosphatase [Myxococcota bacterium]